MDYSQRFPSSIGANFYYLCPDYTFDSWEQDLMWGLHHQSSEDERDPM